MPPESNAPPESSFRKRRHEAAAKLTGVVFTKSAGAYNCGERAGFKAGEALRLVEKGVARYADEEKQAAFDKSKAAAARTKEQVEEERAKRQAELDDKAKPKPGAGKKPSRAEAKAAAAGSDDGAGGGGASG